MNRTFVKAGATAAILAGLMGGVAAAPSVVYADAPAATARPHVVVSSESVALLPQVKDMMDKCVAARPNVTLESWNASGLNYLLVTAKGDYDLLVENVDHFGPLAPSDVVATKIKEADQRIAQDLKKLQDAYKTLVPGVNLMTFTNALTGTDGSAPGVNPWGTSDRMQVNWVPKHEAGTHNAVQGGHPFFQAVDGNTRTSTIIGDTNKIGRVFVQFDLGAEHNLSSFKILRENGKTYAQTAVVVSNDKDFNDKNVLYYSKGDLDGCRGDCFDLGQDPTDKLYTEDGKMHDLLEGKQAVKARYVRLYLNGTTDAVSKDNKIYEIEMDAAETITPENVQKLYDTAALESAVKDANVILNEHAGEYTATSLDALKSQVAACQELINSIKAGTATEPLSAPDAMAGKVNDAIKALVPAVHVTFDDKIDATVDTPVEVVKGEKVAKPGDPKHPEGYTFAGWFLEKDGKTPFDFNAVVDKDMTVYAKWTTKMGEVVEADKPTIPALPIEPAPKPTVPMTPLEPAKKPTQPAMLLEPAKKPTQPAMPLEPAQKQESDKKQESAAKQESGKKNALPQTGDPSMLIAGASAAASAVAFAAARRRK